MVAKAYVQVIPPGNRIIIDCDDQVQLDNIQRLTDGAKIRGMNRIMAHALSITKFGMIKDFVERIFVDEATANLSVAVNKYIRQRIDCLQFCKEEYFLKDIPFDYDYKGKFDVMPHQKVMFNCMERINKVGILAEPGTCKTGPYLWSIDKRIQTGKIKRAIVITLSFLKENVLAEMAVQAPHLSGCILDGSEHADKVINKKFKRASMNRDYDVYIASYESMRGMYRVIPNGFFGMVICDEAHRIGDPTSQQTKKIMSTFEDLKYRYIISGTLNHNNYMSCFMPLRFMGPDTVPYANYNAFRDMYMYRKDQYGYVWAPKPELPSLTAAMLKRTCIFFSKKECLDLPPIVRSKLYCEMSPAQKTMYADLRANLEVILRDIENIKTSINGVEKPSIGMHSDYKLKVSNALTVTGKLHQISSGFVMDTVERLDEDGDLVDDYDVNEIKKIYFFKENPKLDLLMDAIKNELPPDKKAVIWAVNTCAIDMIYDRLSKEKIGGCIKVYKDVNAFQAVESFKTEKYRFMIANPKKAGVGLNMQFSNYQYFYMNGFSYVVRDQAESRQDRKGQTESVNCIDLIAKKSADERIVKVLIEKKEMSDYLNEVCSPDES